MLPTGFAFFAPPSCGSIRLRSAEGQSRAQQLNKMSAAAAAVLVVSFLLLAVTCSAFQLPPRALRGRVPPPQPSRHPSLQLSHRRLAAASGQALQAAQFHKVRCRACCACHHFAARDPRDWSHGRDDDASDKEDATCQAAKCSTWGEVKRGYCWDAVRPGKQRQQKLGTEQAWDAIRDCAFGAIDCEGAACRFTPGKTEDTEDCLPEPLGAHC